MTTNNPKKQDFYAAWNATRETLMSHDEYTQLLSAWFSIKLEEAVTPSYDELLKITVALLSYNEEAGKKLAAILGETSGKVFTTWEQVCGVLKASPSLAWRVCVQTWKGLAPRLNTCKDWTVEKAKQYSKAIADFAVARWNWTRETAIPWAKQHIMDTWNWTADHAVSFWSYASAKACSWADWTWTKVCDFSDWSYTKVCAGAKASWTGITVAYDWTANKVKDIAVWTWNGTCKVAQFIAATAAKVVEKTIAPVVDAILSQTFPMNMTVRVPAGCELGGEYTVSRDLGIRGLCLVVPVNTSEEYANVYSSVEKCSGRVLAVNTVKK